MAEYDFNKKPELRNSQLAELQFASPHKQITEDFMAEVVRVHDGDTITLRASFRDFDFPLRLLGIDTPEMNAGGEKARDWLRGKILDNVVQIRIDRKNRVGKYGRLLGRVFYQGMDLGDEEMRLGLAVPFGQRRAHELPNIDKTFSTRQWFK